VLRLQKTRAGAAKKLAQSRGTAETRICKKGAGTTVFKGSAVDVPRDANTESYTVTAK